MLVCAISVAGRPDTKAGKKQPSVFVCAPSVAAAGRPDTTAGGHGKSPKIKCWPVAGHGKIKYWPVVGAVKVSKILGVIDFV